MLTGDIDFTETSWSNVSSTKDNEEFILDQFIENNLSKVAPSQLDEFLCNNPEIDLNCTYDRSLFKSFSINNKPCSDHFPICPQKNLLLDAPLFQASDKFAYKNTNWKEFNYSLTFDPFTLFASVMSIFFLSNCTHGYKFYEIRENTQFVTKNWASLQPWISN